MTAEKVIVGVVSGGKGCGRPNFPGFYTRVSAFSEFIEAVTCRLSSQPPEYCLAPASTPVSSPVLGPTYLAPSNGGKTGKKEKEGSKPKTTNKNMPSSSGKGGYMEDDDEDSDNNAGKGGTKENMRAKHDQKHGYQGDDDGGGYRRGVRGLQSSR